MSGPFFRLKRLFQLDFLQLGTLPTGSVLSLSISTIWTFVELWSLFPKCPYNWPGSFPTIKTSTARSLNGYLYTVEKPSYTQLTHFAMRRVPDNIVEIKVANYNYHDLAATAISPQWGYSPPPLPPKASKTAYLFEQGTTTGDSTLPAYLSWQSSIYLTVWPSPIYNTPVCSSSNRNTSDTEWLKLLRFLLESW